MNFGKAHEYPWVVAIVIGDEVGFRIGGHQLFATVEGHFDDDFVQILVQADEQLSVDLQGRSSIRRASSTLARARPTRRTVSYVTGCFFMEGCW